MYQRILLLNRHTIRRDQKSQPFRAAKKVGSAGLEIDTISFYDVDKGVLARRLAGKAYGEMNLYQNVGDPTNVGDGPSESKKGRERECTFDDG